MFKIIKKRRLNTEEMFWYGVHTGKIVDFPEEFYDRLKCVYADGLPVYLRIKYLKALRDMGTCFDRAYYMFVCCDDATYVRANTELLKANNGADNSEHAWIEIGDYVYDPSTLAKIKKDLYYEMVQPYNVKKATKEQFLSDPNLKERYDKIKNTTIEDLKPGGKYRLELFAKAPLMTAFADQPGNENFKRELQEFLNEVQYGEGVEKELDDMYNEAIKKGLGN